MSMGWDERLGNCTDTMVPTSLLEKVSKNKIFQFSVHWLQTELVVHRAHTSTRTVSIFYAFSRTGNMAFTYHRDIQAPSPKKRRLNSRSSAFATTQNVEDDDMDDLYADTPPAQQSIDTTSTAAQEITTVPPTSTPVSNAGLVLPGLGVNMDSNTDHEMDGIALAKSDDIEAKLIHGGEDSVASVAQQPVPMSTQETRQAEAMLTTIVESIGASVENEPPGSPQPQRPTTDISTGIEVSGIKLTQAKPTLDLMVEAKQNVDDAPEKGEAAETVETTGQVQHGDTNIIEVSSEPRAAQAAEIREPTSGATAEVEFEADSSPYESSSDDSSDSSSDDSDDSEDYQMLDPEETARRLMEDIGSDDEGGKRAGARGEAPRTQHEKPDEVVEKPSVTVTPEMKIEELGNVDIIVDNNAVIKAKTSGDYQVLETGSLLCLVDRTVIGVVADLLGPVQQPLYLVRFTNAKSMEESGVTKNVTVYYVHGHSTFVFTQPLKGLKGSDASNVHDEEVGDDEMEFSDDEAEAEYKRQKKWAKADRKNATHGLPPHSRGGVKSENYNTAYDADMGMGVPAGISYDDEVKKEEDDGLYTPLARPSNIQDMLRQGGASVESPRDGFSRGRGGHRGRGDRGRGDRGRGGRGGRGRGRGGHRDHHGGSHRHQSNLDLSLPPTPTFGGLSSNNGPSLPVMPSPLPPPPVSVSRGQPQSYQQSHAQQFNFPTPPIPQPHAQYGYNQWQGPQQSSWSGQPQAPYQAAPQAAPHPQVNPYQYQQPFQQHQNQPGQAPPPPFQAGAYVNPAFFAQFQQGQYGNFQGQQK
jgi:H/ACA ribonucleoprotein complex non-core subunit NAF1